ncbi:hypothetical protein DMENIID0001_114800 [Sergentomyia squamirostris]
MDVEIEEKKKDLSRIHAGRGEKTGDGQQEMIGKKLENNMERSKENLKYSDDDKGPYVVIIEKQGINLLITADHLNTIVGEENVAEVRQLSKDRLKVIFLNWESANKAIDKISMDKKNPLKAFIPAFYLTTVGIIDNIPLDADLQQIEKSITAEVKIVNIQRMKSAAKGTLRDLDKVKIFFRSFNLPEKVMIGKAIFRVRNFIPRPTFCKNCLSYGHYGSICKNKKVCPICTQENLENHSCKTYCKFCKNADHFTNSGKCPERVYQTKIKMQMIKDRSTFHEARVKVNREMSLNNEKQKNEQGRIREDSPTETMCEMYKKRLKKLIGVLQLLSRMAFSKEEEDYRILGYMRDTFDEHQELYMTTAITHHEKKN